MTRRLYTLTLLLSLLQLSACQKEVSPERRLIDSLIDTVWAGESREVFLSTGAGQYYYDDALGQPLRSVYGFSDIDGWQVADVKWISEDGKQIGIDAAYTIVSPEWIERHNADGSSLRIEALPAPPGFALTLTFSSKQAGSIRPRISTGCYDTVNCGKPEWAVDQKRRITSGFFDHRIRLEAGDVIEVKQLVETEDQDYPQSRRRYEATSRLLVPAEFLIPASKKWQLIIEFPCAEKNAPAGDEIATQIEMGRSVIRGRSENAMHGFQVITGDDRINFAVAWARLSLSAMIYRRDGATYLMAGIPDHPKMRSLDAALCLPGLLQVDSSGSTALDIAVGVPLQSDSAQVVPFGVGGALAIGIDYIQEMLDSLPQQLELGTLRKMDVDIPNTLRRQHLVAGLLTEHPSLFDPPIGSEDGASIDAQALFLSEREFIKRGAKHLQLQTSTPEVILSGTTRWTLPNYPPVALDSLGVALPIPLNRESILGFYHDPTHKRWNNQVVIPLTINDPLLVRFDPKQPLPVDTSVTAAEFIATGWLSTGVERDIKGQLSAGITADMFTRGAIRSLSPHDPHYQSSHPYEWEGDQNRSCGSGEALVWTGGRLADMWRIAGEPDSAVAVFLAQTERILHSGVVGGLGEVEESELTDYRSGYIRNPLYALSLSEYLRIFQEDIIGLKSAGRDMPSLSPIIPAEWGDVTIRFPSRGAMFTVSRTGDVWRASVAGTTEIARLAFTLEPTPGVKVLRSFQITEEQPVTFKLRKLREGRWKIDQLEPKGQD